ncbi:ABC transporter ATP-binding protein [Derxia lacustris]|uniref:ABC transporter ATP-binding protein n=1 Tax=Derxia lacustris TaxID=764842 RepID=UPI001F484FF8|nr:ABC transporter ATP-binding protein [Derxia lacustris]
MTTATAQPHKASTMNAATTVLSVSDLRLSYGDNPILKGVSMDLHRGEVISLLGPSGSGKTTLLRAVAGLEQPHEGRIAIAGKTVFDGAGRIEIPAEQRNLGLVFQSYALWPHKTVFDNVAYGLKLRKTDAATIKERVGDALENLGLGHLGARYPHQLSGGQQQRVAIARALVYNPPVILLDEPLSNLDAKLREEARAWLRELIVRLQLSALVVTHDQGEAMAMSDRILLLNGGKIEQQGTPTEMYSQPASLFVAGFMGTNNTLKGRVRSRTDDDICLDLGEHKLWGKRRGQAAPGGIGDEAVGVVRVEGVKLAAGPGPNCLPMDLVTSMYLGDRWEYVLDSAGTLVRAHGNAPIEAGRRWVEIPPERLWVFA